MIELTPRAAKQVRHLMTENGLTEGFGLRVGIQPGGCSGFSYLLDIGEREEGDQIFHCDDIEVYVDPKSHALLDGLRIDYESGLMGGGFKFDNPNAKKSCGCGTSFQC